MSRPEQKTEVIPPMSSPEARSFWDTIVGKPRAPGDLARDPALLFSGAHLAGVVVGKAHGLMTRREPISPEESKEIGEFLVGAAAFFYEDAKPKR